MGGLRSRHTDRLCRHRSRNRACDRIRRPLSRDQQPPSALPRRAAFTTGDCDCQRVADVCDRSRDRSTRLRDHAQRALSRSLVPGPGVVSGRDRQTRRAHGRQPGAASSRARHHEGHPALLQHLLGWDRRLPAEEPTGGAECRDGRAWTGEGRGNSQAIQTLPRHRNGIERGAQRRARGPRRATRCSSVGSGSARRSS